MKEFVLPVLAIVACLPWAITAALRKCVLGAECANDSAVEGS
jgi:hypothetical protein